MAYVGITQVFKPGGINGTAGTPNFLTSLDGVVGQLGGASVVQWTDIQIGGLQKATIQMVRPLEQKLDIVAGNWLYFALGGGTLSSAAGAGASSLTVTGLGSQFTGIGGLIQGDIMVGDYILVSDGTNTDLMAVSSVTLVSGNTYTIGLASAPGQATSTTLNAYSIGAIVARLQFSGYLYRREPTTELTNKFVLEVYGFSARYNNVLCNADIVDQDSATSILNLCQSYAPTLPEVLVSSANFAAANSIMATTSAKNGKVFKVITDILKAENSHDANTNYAFWVDAAREAHHAIIPGANVGTPTGSLGYAGSTPATPTFTIDLLAGSNVGDSLGPIDVQDMDLSKMVNTAIVNGGTKKDKTQLAVIVQDTTSQAAWGYYEGTWTNPDLVDDTAASLWGARQPCLTAYPLTTAKAKLPQAPMRIDSRTLLQITGFTDGSIMQFNPTQVQYTWDARKQIVTASLDLAQARPDIGSIMAEGMREVAQRAGVENPGSQVIDTYVVSGFDLSIVGLTATIAAGTLSYNGTLYDFPAYSYTFSGSYNGAVEFGAQVGGIAPSGVTLPSVVPLPSVTGLSTMYAHAVYSISRPPIDGGAPISITLEQQFLGLDLYRVTAQNGTITGWIDQRTGGGVSNKNLQPPAAASPTVGSPTITLAAEGAASAVATVTFMATNITPDPSYAAVELVYSLHGANQWHPAMAIARNMTSFGAAFTGYVHGLAAQQAYDFAYQVRGLNGSLVAGGPYLIGSVTAAQVTAAIATWNEFGGTVNTDGSWSNVDGHSTSTQYTIGSGQPVIIAGQIQKGVATQDARLMIGNLTNGYAIDYDGSGSIYIEKFVAGAVTVISGILGIPNDTNPHSFRLTISNSGGTNNIEGTVDQHALAATDTSLTLTTGTWPVTVYTGGNAGKLSHYAFAATSQHFGGLPANVQNPLIPPWDAGYSDGSTIKSGVLFGRHMSGAPASDTGALFDANGHALHTRMSGAVQGTIQATQNGPSYLQSGAVGLPHLDAGTGTNQISTDGIPDGVTYARVKGTELATGFVKQLNDGTNVRTAAQVGGVIASSGGIQLQEGFGSKLILEATGTYANCYQMTVDQIVGGVPVVIETGQWLWMDWYGQFPSASTNGWGPIVSDTPTSAAANGYYIDSYDGMGTYGYFASGVAHNIGSLGANNANTAGIHHFRMALNYQGPNGSNYIYRVQAFVDDCTTPILDFTDSYSQMNPSSIYPGFGNDPGTTVYFTKLPLVQRGGLAYTENHPAVTNTLDVNGNLKSSTTFKTNVPNSLANLVSDIALGFNAGTTGSTTLEIWFHSASGNSSNPNGATLPAWMYPDGSGGIYPTAAECGTSSSPLHTFTGLTSGATYVVVAGLTIGTMTFSYNIYLNSPTQAQVLSVVEDGELLAASASASAGIIIGSGSGTITGGGGHQVHD